MSHLICSALIHWAPRYQRHYEDIYDPVPAHKDVTAVRESHEYGSSANFSKMRSMLSWNHSTENHGSEKRSTSLNLGCWWGQMKRKHPLWESQNIINGKLCNVFSVILGVETQCECRLDSSKNGVETCFAAHSVASTYDVSPITGLYSHDSSFCFGHRNSFTDILRAILLSLEVLIEDPELQINGFILIIDWSNFSFKQASKLTPSILKLAIEGLQVCSKNV